MIPSSFIQDLLARTDIVDLVGRHVTLKKAGINYKGLCPFHGEKSPSFIVSPSRQTYHCFGCGVHGNALGFLMENAGLGFVEAVKELAQMQGMPVPDDDARPEDREKAKAQKEKQATLTDVMAQATRHWKQQLKKSPRAVAYLKGRGLTGEIAARFGLGLEQPDYNLFVLGEVGSGRASLLHQAMQQAAAQRRAEAQAQLNYYRPRQATLQRQRATFGRKA